MQYNNWILSYGINWIACIKNMSHDNIWVFSAVSRCYWRIHLMLAASEHRTLNYVFEQLCWKPNVHTFPYLLSLQPNIKQMPAINDLPIVPLHVKHKVNAVKTIKTFFIMALSVSNCETTAWCTNDIRFECATQNTRRLTILAFRLTSFTSVNVVKTTKHIFILALSRNCQLIKQGSNCETTAWCTNDIRFECAIHKRHARIFSSLVRTSVFSLVKSTYKC